MWTGAGGDARRARPRARLTGTLRKSSGGRTGAKVRGTQGGGTMILSMLRGTGAPTRRTALKALAAAAAVAVAGCTGGNLNQGGFNLGDAPDTAPQKFETVGEGSVKVALLLPLSAQGNAGSTAKALKQSAELALFEFNNPDIVLVPKDTQGTAQGAAAAAQQALSEGAQLIVGPLFAQSVSAVGPIARNANVPVIAFSTDANVAGRGVYLLSFLPNDDISQIVAYAAKKGLKSYAALVPETAYGTLAEGALRQAAANVDGQVAVVARYPQDPSGFDAPAKQIAQVAAGDKPQAAAVLMPDGPATTPRIAPVLTLNGVDPKKVKFLGSGQWDDAAIGQEPSLVGGWYAAPNPAGWQNFSGRYQATYGAQPPRISTIAYDAVSLAAALASQAPGGQPYTAQALTNPDGFAGVDGLFRFLANGTNQRGLAILEVQAGGGGKVIQPAPSSFANRSF